MNDSQESNPTGGVTNVYWAPSCLLDLVLAVFGDKFVYEPLASNSPAAKRTSSKRQLGAEDYNFHSDKFQIIEGWIHKTLSRSTTCEQAED